MLFVLALFHDIWQATTSEAEKAVKELDIACLYLQKAEKSHLAGSVYLKLTPKENDSTVQDRYDAVKKDIGCLVSIMAELGACVLTNSSKSG